jgi:hypothetical protein
LAAPAVPAGGVLVEAATPGELADKVAEAEAGLR